MKIVNARNPKLCSLMLVVTTNVFLNVRFSPLQRCALCRIPEDFVVDVFIVPKCAKIRMQKAIYGMKSSS